MRIRKSRCVESDGTCCCTRKFNAALSLCGVLGVALYFPEGFSEAATRESAVAEALQLLCYKSKLKELSNEITLVLSNIRELDRVSNTK